MLGSQPAWPGDSPRHAQPSNCSSTGPSLGGRLVLCIGRRKPLIDQNRRLVTGCNGGFEHHDGRVEDKQRRLEALLAAADAVVCATGSVSRTAHDRTKGFHERLEKAHVRLGHSGISSCTGALEQLSACNATLAAGSTADGTRDVPALPVCPAP